MGKVSQKAPERKERRAGSIPRHSYCQRGGGIVRGIHTMVRRKLFSCPLPEEGGGGKKTDYGKYSLEGKGKMQGGKMSIPVTSYWQSRRGEKGSGEAYFTTRKERTKGLAH